MKNFEKFQSRALNADALKEIKGGMSALACHPVTPQCASIYLNCASYCYGDINDWFTCVQSQPGSGSCSPLVGWDNVCYYTDCY